MGVGYVSTLASAQNAGTALSSFTTAASLLQGNASQALHTMAPDDWFIGKMLRIYATIAIGNVVTAQPTFTFDVKFGATTVFSTGAILTSTTAHTALPCALDIVMTCRSVGSAATLIGQATILGRPFVDSTAVGDSVQGHTDLVVPKTTPAVGNTFSSNTSQQVDLHVSCSASNAANTAQLFQYMLVDHHCLT